MHAAGGSGSLALPHVGAGQAEFLLVRPPSRGSGTVGALL